MLRAELAQLQDHPDPSSALPSSSAAPDGDSAQPVVGRQDELAVALKAEDELRRRVAAGLDTGDLTFTIERITRGRHAVFVDGQSVGIIRRPSSGPSRTRTWIHDGAGGRSYPTLASAARSLLVRFAGRYYRPH